MAGLILLALFAGLVYFIGVTDSQTITALTLNINGN
jgi:hypothetical protein